MLELPHRPFRDAEYQLMRGFLHGTSDYFAALNYQLESLTYGSRLFRSPRPFGIRMPWLAVQRAKARLTFRVAWGYGGEDFVLGERRLIRLTDVVALLSDGSLLRGELRISHGRLQELLLLGRAWAPGGVVEKPPSSLRAGRIAIKKVFFVPNSDQDVLSLPGELSEKRFLQTPHPLLDLSGGHTLNEFQRWLLSLDRLHIYVSDKYLPLKVYRATPAHQDELSQFEQSRGFTIPEELRDLWNVTNGCSLFGETVYGTYEIAQFKRGDGIIEMPLIKSQSREGDYVVVQINTKKNESIVRLPGWISEQIGSGVRITW